MLNQLHLAMLELYKGDAKRIQHFCKVHSYAKLIAECEKVDKETLFIFGGSSTYTRYRNSFVKKSTATAAVNCRKRGTGDSCQTARKIGI